MTLNRWTEEQVKLAFYLYCQLPFGKLHQGNPDIIALAALIQRTPSAVAFKLSNLASLDPAIRNSGRKGMGNVSKLDKQVWDEFHADWEGLADECITIRAHLSKEMAQSTPDIPTTDDPDDKTEDFTGETRQVVTQQRIKQSFFRKAVLSSYNNRCCITGLSHPSLLIASHIVPWSKDKANRLNPSNGLCLSALHDRAFDQGLITLDQEWRVVLSSEIKRQTEPVFDTAFFTYEGQQVELPWRFAPDEVFMERHRAEVFIG